LKAKRAAHRVALSLSEIRIPEGQEMKNYKQNGAVLSVLAAATITSGDGVLTGTIFGVAQTDAISGENVEVVRAGVFTLPKVSAQAWTQGAKIYWDDTAKLATTVATANTVIGAATEIAANPSGTGDVLLDGTIR